MTFQPFRPPVRTLMGPGPSDVHPRVSEALARPTIGHLDPAFVSLMDEVKVLLQHAFRTTHAMTIPISGPGTAGMQAAVDNLIEPGDRAVVCSNGVFGGRIADMMRRAGGEVTTVEDAWGEPVDPGKLEEALRAHPGTRVAAFVHAETSTGARSDVETLARIAREHGALSLVDTVTSLGGIPLEVDGWQLDAVFSGTQKCLSAPPGLSPLTFSDRALEVVRSRSTPVKSWFLDLNLILGYWGEGAQRSYHHTAPINMIYALHEALLMVQEEGLENSWKRHHENHLALRRGLEALGLEFVVEEPHRLPQLNAIAVPGGVDESDVRRRLLEEHNLEIGAGLGPMAGKIWRIGLMGYASREENVEKCLGALENALGR